MSGGRENETKNRTFTEAIEGQVQEMWIDIDSVMRRIRKIQRRIRAAGEPVSQSEIHELKQLGREYTGLIKRLPTDSDK